MDIEIVVIGESSKWVLSYPRIRIGQDPNCEVSLPPGRYPSVAGEHLVLEMVNGAVSLARGISPGGETYLNGHPAGAGAAIRSGDILRLGAGGPELRIRLLEREVYAPPAVHEPTRVQHEPTRVISGPTAAAYSSPPPIAPAVGRQGYSSDAARGVSAAPRPPLQQSAGSADDGEGLRALENKLKTIRNILLANLVILVVLLGCIFWQSSELAQTRDEVQQLHAQAQNAAGQLMPQLNDRLGVFEQRMDGMDAKIAAAQDRMVNRMNTAIPAMLDKYIAGKLAEVRR